MLSYKYIASLVIILLFSAWQGIKAQFCFHYLLLIFQKISLIQLAHTSDGERWQQSRIIGGTAAQPGHAEHQAALQHKGSFICGASIITRYAVITAGHCVT